METGAFYTAAREFADKIKNEKPNYVSDSGAALCLIKTDNDKLFTGVTGISVGEDGVKTVAAEYAAIMSMRIAGETRAVQMITVLFEDESVAKPGEDCIKLLIASNPENSGCEIAVSSEESAAAENLIEDKSGEAVDFFAGFGFGDGGEIPAFDGSEDIFNVTGGADDSDQESAEENAEDSENAEISEETAENSESAETENSGAQAEFSNGVSIDESNPFYEPEAADEAPTNVLAAMDGETKQEAADADGEEDADDDDDDEPVDKKGKKGMSKGDLLKQAKKRKKIARANFNFRKR